MSSRAFRTRRRGPDDGLLIAILAVLIGAIPVVAALGAHRAFGVEATVGLGLVGLGLLGLLVRGSRR